MKVICKSLAFSLLFLITTYSYSEVKTVLGKDQFNKEVLEVSKSKPVIVKFGAPWCPACVRSKAPYEKTSNDPEFANVAFVEMDFDKNNETANNLGVQSLPTFVPFKNGKAGTQVTGFSENLKNEIRNMIASLGAAASAPAPTESVQEPKKNEEEQAAQAPTTQEEVSNPACATGQQGFFANAINGMSNFFNSIWNTVTGWFK
jgi:thioredoxin-like negative regulator of GroEL